MDLFVVRHAVAYGRDAERWPDDAERPLTPDGEERFRREAAGLLRIVPEVDLVLSSPFARAWRTAEILNEAGWPEPKVFPAFEPEVPPREVALALEPYAETGSVAVVGHRPGLHELVSYLLTGDAEGADVRIKKGGAARLRLEGDPRPGSASLRWLLTPEILRSC